MSSQKTAIVIDDHPLVVRGVAMFLKSHCGFDDVLEIDNPHTFLDYINLKNSPAIILLDFWLSDGASIKLLNEIKIKYPVTPILVVSADDDISVQKKVQFAGAHGFILKHESTDVLMRAVACLLSGKTWFVKQEYTHNYQPKELAITPLELGLTTRQGEILAMILKGLPNKRIAQTLSLSEQTVKEHVSGILSKLGVANRIEAITLLRGKRLE